MSNSIVLAADPSRLASLRLCSGTHLRRANSVPVLAAPCDPGGSTASPDWACEVLSPSTEKLDRDEKLPYYAKHGVRQVWLVDALDRRLEVYSLSDNQRWHEVRIFHGDATVRADPFAAVEIELNALWSSPRR